MLALFFFSGIKGQPTRRLCVLTWFCTRQVVFKFSCPLSPFDLIKSFTPSLCLEPLAKHKKVTTIETWLSSFHVFVGAYTKQFPHEAPALMKYGEIIQDLAGRGHSWTFYDENVRFLRQAHRAALPWDPW